MKTETEQKPFEIYQNSHHSFTFMNRIRILFGKKMHTNGTIYVDKEVNVIKGEMIGYVNDFFPKKDIGLTDSYNNNTPI